MLNEEIAPLGCGWFREGNPEMCRAVECRICGKTTWAGCGQHVASVKASVPSSQWCGGKHTQAQLDAAQANQKGFLARLLGR